MTTTIEAVYEAGVLRPLSPLELEEGERVAVTVAPSRLPGPPLPKPGARTPAEILAEIALLAVPQAEPETSSRDHDKVLYGESGAR